MEGVTPRARRAAGTVRPADRGRGPARLDGPGGRAAPPGRRRQARGAGRARRGLWGGAPPPGRSPAAPSDHRTPSAAAVCVPAGLARARDDASAPRRLRLPPRNPALCHVSRAGPDAAGLSAARRPPRPPPPRPSPPASPGPRLPRGPPARRPGPAPSSASASAAPVLLQRRRRRGAEPPLSLQVGPRLIRPVPPARRRLAQTPPRAEARGPLTPCWRPAPSYRPRVRRRPGPGPRRISRPDSVSPAGTTQAP